MVLEISKAQMKCIKTLVGKLKVEDAEALVLGFTGMRTAHVSDMKAHEAAGLIKHLKTQDPDEAKADKMRKKIIAIAYKRAGLSRNASKEQKKEAMQELDSWLLKFGYLKKKLDDYRVKELPKLVTQYEAVYKSFIKSV